MKKIILTALISMLTISIQAKAKNDTIVVTPTPQMHCQNCENKIKKNIRFVKGTKNIETSVANQTVKIIFDSSKSNFEDFVSAFKKIGYDIKKVDKK